MKNKKFTKGLALTLLSAGLILTNCTKDKTNTAPTPDTDTQAVKDVMKAQLIVADIADIAMQASDGNVSLLAGQSYTPLTVPMGTTTAAGSIAAIVTNTVTKKIVVYLSNSVTTVPTMGKDGIVKTGTLNLDYSTTTEPTSQPAVFAREAGYISVVTASNLMMDNYSITINSMSFKNTTPIGFPITAPYTPANYPLTFKVTANITIMHPSATSTSVETITWNGSYTKTILNTSLTPVPMPTPMSMQTFTVYPTPYNSAFKQGAVYYSIDGSINGTTSQNDAYVLDIPVTTPLKRNMNNSPSAFASVGNVIQAAELHPFVSGTVTVKPGVKTTRSVAFGTPENVDYNATVNIDGINYSMDFK